MRHKTCSQQEWVLTIDVEMAQPEMTVEGSWETR